MISAQDDLFEDAAGPRFEPSSLHPDAGIDGQTHSGASDLFGLVDGAVGGERLRHSLNRSGWYP